MNAVSKKPSVMKSNSHPNFYFSAYPLKVLNEQETEKKSYLHLYSTPKTKKKFAGSLKILPMVNPYTAKDEARLQNLGQQTNINNNNNVEERDNDWFAHYE